MDGKERALDNIWIERFWRSIKYDFIYLHPAEDGFELYDGVHGHINYHHEKVHNTTRETPKNLFENSIRNAA